MSNLLMKRNPVKAEPLDCAAKTPATFNDRDGWPIRIGARVTLRRRNKHWTGTVTQSYSDHVGRPVIVFACGPQERLCRPTECRVQAGKAGS